MYRDKFLKGFKLVISSIMVAAMFLILSMDNKVYGASATVSISTATATQGEEVSVTVEVSADSNIGAYDFYLEYDADILEAVSGFDGGGGGRIQIIYDVPDTNSVSKSVKKTVTFKAKAPGTSTIKYVCVTSENGVIDFDTVDNMAVTAKDGSVTVKAPVVASTNNNLSSMTVAAVRADGSTYNVELSPAFAKDVTNYNLEVEEGVTKLVISAKAEDSKATVAIQWANLDPGENTTKVIVTAEDGSKKQYNIYTNVPKEPETTTAPVEPITVNIGGTEYYVGNISDGVQLPEGFEAYEYDYKGNTVVAGKGLSKNLIVMYLTNGDGSAGSLYIYDETKDSFYQMVNIEMTQKLYTIVEAPEELLIPDGFSECTINIGETSFQGWKNGNAEGIYLVYAMNWNGKSGLYFYDEDEKQMIKYFDLSVEAGAVVGDNNNSTENESLSDNQTNKNEENDKTNIYKYIAYGCGAASVILLGVVIILATKRKSGSKESDELEEYDEEAQLDEEWDGGPAVESEDDPEDEPAVEAEEASDDESVMETEEVPEDEPAMETEGISEDEPAMEAEEIPEDEPAMETEEFPDDEPVMETEEVIEDEPVTEADEIVEEVMEDEPVMEAEKPVQEDSHVVEFASEIADGEVPLSEDEEDIMMDFEDIITAQVAREIEEEKSENADKKKKVTQILEDEDTSIENGDIDLVIDELFDDLFGE